MFSNQRLFLMLVCFIMTANIGSLCATPSAAQFVGEVTGTRVNVRTGPHLSHQVVFAAEKGQELFVIKEKDAWANVLLPEHASVWIHGNLVEKLSNTEGIVTKDGVNIRVKPNTQTYILGQADKGDTVTIQGEQFGWYRIKAPKGTSAWISKAFFRKSKTIEEYKQAKRHIEVQDLYKNVEHMHNEELLKPLEKRDMRFLLEQYERIMKHFSEFPESTLAKHRYLEIKEWQAEQEWAHIENKWQNALKSQEESINLKEFVETYNNFITNYPETKTSKIAKDRLHFLNKKHIINTFDVNSLREGRYTETVLKGVIHDLGKLINRPATHKLISNGEIVCLLRSKTVDLSTYVLRNVELEGRLIKIKGWNIPIFEVTKVKSKSWKGRF